MPELEVLVLYAELLAWVSDGFKQGQAEDPPKFLQPYSSRIFLPTLLLHALIHLIPDYLQPLLPPVSHL